MGYHMGVLSTGTCEHVGQNEKAMEAQGFNACLQGVDVNELFEEFTETSVVKQ